MPWLVVASVVALQGAAAAEPSDPSKRAITDIRDVDDDFAFQGEYSGQVITGQPACGIAARRPGWGFRL
jgi:hypothetical protein